MSLAVKKRVRAEYSREALACKYPIAYFEMDFDTKWLEVTFHRRSLQEFTCKKSGGSLLRRAISA